MTARMRAKAFAARQAANLLASYLAARSDRALIGLAHFLEIIAKSPGQKESFRMLRAAFEAGHPCIELGRRVFREVHPNCRRKLINNMGVNMAYVGWPLRKAREDRGLAAPFLMVISPSMRCNLRCAGCYAGQYCQKDDLPFEVLDRVITEAKSIGVYFFTISGGEPFIRRDLLDIFEKHGDAYFQVYTNGTLIDEAMARRLVELGNVGPAISIEGYEAETNARRGKGVYNKVIRAMENLRNEGAIFGFSGTVTRHNAELITSDELIERMIELGCLFGWYFTYIPIGRHPDTSLMATPQQRQIARENVWRARTRKPIWIADFWNDGRLTNGCMAGGRFYLHINSRGDVEPCVFCHFALDNVNEKTLEEALESPFFKAIRRRFPWSDNLLTPCMIIDHPEVLREAIIEGGARPTHEGAETLVTEIADDLDAYAAEMERITACVPRDVRCVPIFNMD